MAVYSIKELEKLSGIKAHTIRIWEKRYGLIEPKRTKTNIRCYTDDNLKKLLNVAVLNRHGIKISHIARLNELELKDEILRISKQSNTEESLIDSMVLSMINVNDYKLESLIDKSIQKLGFKSAVIDVFYPFLRKIGILWIATDIYPAQEHVVTNLIRQKIISAVDQLKNPYNPDSKRFLLLLPEGEWHELPLLFAHYLIKQVQHEVIYLGQSVPYSDVLTLGASMEFDHILVSSMVPKSASDLNTYLGDLGRAFPDKKIMYFDGKQESQEVPLPKNLIHLHEIEELTHLIEHLG